MRRFVQQITPDIRTVVGGYEMDTGYNAGFVADLKVAIPASHRKYDPATRRWTVSAQYGEVAVALIEQHFKSNVALPPLLDTEQSISGILKVLYLGVCKTRADGESTASGWSENGSWDMVFPESVLRKWFDEGPEAPTGNYFSILGVKIGATDEEIRNGYRRMAKQWHPDLNHEYNAAAVFMKIQQAYDVLKDGKMRVRYEAGLKLEATLNSGNKTAPISAFGDKYGYRAPLRSGLILAQYAEGVGRVIVSEIKHWADITNDIGQTLVSSWVMGEDAPRLEWV